MKKGYNIIGDIAGQYKTLLALLEKMPKESTPVSVGDMVDRGPSSKLVLDFFRDNGKAILGNHEHMMISTYRKSKYYDSGVWFMNGGRATMESFGSPITFENIPIETIEWLESLPLFLKFKDVGPFGLKGFISHAIKRPDWSLETACKLGPSAYSSLGEDSIIWNRGSPRRMRAYYQICGHNSHWGLERFKDKAGEYGICIDTSRSKIMTGIHWPSGEIFQQEFVDETDGAPNE